MAALAVTERLRRRARRLVRKVSEEIDEVLGLLSTRETELRTLADMLESALTAMFATPADYSVAEDTGCFTVRKRVRTDSRWPYANIKRFHFTPSDADSKQRARAAAHSLLDKLNENQ